MMKRQYGSIHIGVIENFDQNTIGFNWYWLLTKDWSKDYMVKTWQSSKKVLNEKEYRSTHTFFLKNFVPRDNMVQPI